MSRPTKHGKQGRAERANERLLVSQQKEAPLWQKPCCPDCEKIARQGETIRDFHDIRECLLLNEQQARMYWAWVSDLNQKYGEADEILEGVSITFMFTPHGRSVVAHTGNIDAREGVHCTLEDV